MEIPKEVKEFAEDKGFSIYYVRKLGKGFWAVFHKDGELYRYKVKKILGEPKFIPWNDLSMLNFSEKLDPYSEPELMGIYSRWCSKSTFWEFMSFIIEKREGIYESLKDWAEKLRSVKRPYEFEISFDEVELRNSGDYNGRYYVLTIFVENYSIPYDFSDEFGSYIKEIAKKYKLLYAVVHGHSGDDTASPGDLNTAKRLLGMKVIKPEC